MPRLSDYTEAPYQGVSQAPSQVRLKTQAESIEDAALSIPQGVEKRAPWEFVAKLNGHPGQNDGTFELVRKDGVDYAFTLTRESGVTVPRLYPLTGLPLAHPGVVSSVAITVESAAQVYLNTAPEPGYAASVLTVEDYTFILSKKQVVGKAAGTSPTRPNEAMLWVRAAAYAKLYQVTVNPSGGTTVSFDLRTPNGKDESDGNFVDTDIIAKALVDGIYPDPAIGGAATATTNGANTGGTPLTNLTAQGFTVSRVAGVIYISHPTIDFTVTVQDGQGGNALTAIKGKVQAFSDLPAKAVNGFIVRVTQQSGSADDDFFVTFQETAGPGTGVWTESIGAGAELGLNPLHMPVGLVKESGAWKVKELPWKGRTVGDQLLAPDPDFVGRTLADITFWKGRLGLISEEGITLSSASDPFTMYPSTLATVTASDAVSLLNPFDQKANFSFAIPFEQKLILWGDLAQAQVVSTNGPFTPDSADIDEFSTYEYAPLSRPQGSNNRLYFLAPRGKNYSTAYEMDINQTTAKVEGDDLSVGVPKYIPADCDRIASCPVNYQIVYARSGDLQITPHLFRYVEKQRVQNAWSKWNLPPGFSYGGGFFVNTTLYALANYNGAGYIIKMDCSPGNLDPDIASSILTRLDLRISEAGVLRAYDSPSDTTLVALPYPAPNGVQVVVRAPGGEGGPELQEGVLLPAPEGTMAEVLSQVGSVVTLSGDWTQAPFWVGTPYVHAVELSKFYARDPQDSPLRSGRLSLRVLILDLDETAYAQVKVTVGGRVPKLYTFEGGYHDDPNSDYDKMLLYSGPWRVPLKGTNEAIKIEFLNSSPYPSRLLGYTWEGELNLKAGRNP